MLSNFQLIARVQQVELVGDKGWWHQNSDSMILAFAAITAAAIAAYVAIRNQREQLGHDRYLRKQDHIRNTVDEALISANEARTVMDHFMANIETAEEFRLEDEAIPPDVQEELDKIRESALAQLHAMLATQVRVEARLNESHPIATSHKELARAYSDLVGEGLDGIFRLRDEETRETDEERKEEGEEAFKQFQDACQEWFNS